MNHFADAARAKKVSRMLPFVPFGTDAAQVHEIADRMAAWKQADRDELARAAGVNVPSPTTWNALVAALREREPAEDLADAWGGP